MTTAVLYNRQYLLMFWSIKKLYAAYERFTPFTDEEAWTLFRLAAISEAVGWSLLIIGIACENLPVWWHEIPVQLAGRIHGMLFLLYVVAVLVLSPTLRWPWYRIIIAGLFSVPPYGSLMYELWSAERRQRHAFNHLFGFVGYLQVLQRQVNQ